MNTTGIVSRVVSQTCSDAGRTRVMESVGVATAIALLLTAAAQIRYPIPGSPVPATLQTLVVLCAGTLVGTRLGLAGIGLYLLFGLAGFAAFAGGSLDWRILPGPTAGYLAGFLVAQPILGRLCSANKRNAWKIAIGILVAQAAIFGLGLAWLKIWSQADWGNVFSMGLWPFVPVDVMLKSVAAFGVAWIGGRQVRRWLTQA